jgi:ABC-type multidrug transport system permease subunit
MSKLKLNADALQVNSFQTAEVQAETGAMQARATYGQWTCGIYCPPTTNPQTTGPCAC